MGSPEVDARRPAQGRQRPRVVIRGSSFQEGKQEVDDRSKSSSANPMELRERDIAKTCSDILIWDGWRMLITDPVSDKSRGKGFGEKGMADRLYIRYLNKSDEGPWWRCMCQVMFIEWKRTVRGKATKATPHQLDWHRDERARGALTLIAGEDFPATIEGFCAWYNASGLQRNGRR